MTYELWDVTISRNLGQFDSEEDALTEVLALVDHFGDGHAEYLVLVGGDDGDNVTGGTLVERARRLVPAHAG